MDSLMIIVDEISDEGFKFKFKYIYIYIYI